VTFRAARILSEVDLIAAEDTRKTGILLKHLSLRKPMISYHSHNEVRRVPDLIRELASGKSVAIVTDAGTPGVSDPAYSVIRAAIQHGIRVLPIPGPTAFLPALIASGLPMQRFVFEGFFPTRKGRTKRWQMLKQEQRTIILYESPHRIEKTLEEVMHNLGDREIALVREITKKFEEVVRGTASFVLQRVREMKPKGEMVLVIRGDDRSGESGVQMDEPIELHESSSKD
jgi:16S rRNA (cytidine1402-2'-O)-methyltransferase